MVQLGWPTTRPAGGVLLRRLVACVRASTETLAEWAEDAGEPWNEQTFEWAARG